MRESDHHDGASVTAAAPKRKFTATWRRCQGYFLVAADAKARGPLSAPISFVYVNTLGSRAHWAVPEDKFVRTGDADSDTEVLEIFDRFDRELPAIEARADRLMKMYGLN